VQKRLYEEQLSIFGEHGTHDNVEQSHLAEMKYLESCVKESLRLYPSVPVISRTVEAKTEIDGYILDKGKTIIAFIYYLHGFTNAVIDCKSLQLSLYSHKQCKYSRTSLFKYILISLRSNNIHT
jgi:hypothetical protein